MKRAIIEKILSSGVVICPKNSVPLKPIVGRRVNGLHIDIYSEVKTYYPKIVRWGTIYSVQGVKNV